VVYRGGLENRFGLTANGGSNPSLSAKEFLEMNFYIQLLVWVVVVGVVFGVLWRTGQLARLANYVAETREELKKCTWPSRDELKGSTIMVLLSIVGLGLFTFLTDLALTLFVKGITAR
jgi:preprotein translocase subunit SecE